MSSVLSEILPGDVWQVDWGHYRRLDEFLSALPRNPDTMAHSAAYFLHTGRRGLYLVRDKNSSAFVAAHPNIEKTFLVLPAGGNPAQELWRDICQKISDGGWNVSLGRVPDTLVRGVDTLRAFKLVTEQTLDWRYPVTIIDNRKLSNLDGSEYSQYRRKVRRAKRRGAISIVNQTSPMYAKLEAPVKRMVEEWAQAVSAIKNFNVEHLVSSNLSAYRLGLSAKAQMEFRIYVSGIDVIGFCASELPATGSTANGIAMCVDRGWVGCSEFMYWSEASEILRQGYDFYNINGSETKSLDEFRSKLRPADKVSLHTFKLFSEGQGSSRNTMMSCGRN